MMELALHILDALQNSVEASATWIRLTIEENRATNLLRIRIEDNGRGMSPETVRRVIDPFVTSRRTRHVGLGLPLFAEAAKQAGGSFLIESARGRGTSVTASFRHDHIDRAPLGDVAGAIVAVLLAPKPVEIFFEHRSEDRMFRFDSGQARAVLGDVHLSEPRVAAWVLAHLRDGEADLQADGGVPDPGPEKAAAGSWNAAAASLRQEYERCPD
jgi:anti-sigma regulatory factor (Ser/Thr protein kinase)